MFLTQSEFWMLVTIFMMWGGVLYLRFSQELPPRIKEIVDLANYLEISEFDFFEDAAKESHWGPRNKRQLEKDFIRYLTDYEIPIYVRDYVRKQRVERTQT